MKPDHQELIHITKAEARRRRHRLKYARKRAEWQDRRKILLMFMRPCWLSLLFLLMSFTAFGQVYVTLEDTNQVKLLPAGIKVAWHTNLYLAQTFVDVTTNWSMVGPPIDVKTNGILIARRIYQVGTLITNTYFKITFQDVVNVIPVSQASGPVIETRNYDIPPPLPQPPSMMATPLRQPSEK